MQAAAVLCFEASLRETSHGQLVRSLFEKDTLNGEANKLTTEHWLGLVGRRRLLVV